MQKQTKTQQAKLNKLFDKANEYYHSNHGKITSSLDNYKSFEKICDALINSGQYDIDTSLTRMQQYKALNRIFDNHSTETSIDDLLELEL